MIERVAYSTRLVPLLVVLSAAACSPRPIRLHVAVSEVTTAPEARSGIPIYLEQFTDRRSSPHNVGQARSGFGGLRRDEYVLDQDVAALVRLFVGRGVVTQGHVLVDEAANAAVIVRGTVVQLEVNMVLELARIAWRANVDTILEVRDPQGGTLLRHGVAEEWRTTAIASAPGGQSSAEKTLSEVLNRLAQKVAADRRLQAAIVKR